MIRELLESDIEEFNLLYRYFSNKNITYKQIESHDFTKYLIYLVDDKIIAFLVYSLIYERSELDYIYVLDEYQKCGVATKLMNYYINLCINMKCVNITLEVNENNVAAINLYKKMGFGAVSKRLNYYGDASALLMIRKFGD